MTTHQMEITKVGQAVWMDQGAIPANSQLPALKALNPLADNTIHALPRLQVVQAM